VHPTLKDWRRTMKYLVVAKNEVCFELTAKVMVRAPLRKIVQQLNNIENEPVGGTTHWALLGLPTIEAESIHAYRLANRPDLCALIVGAKDGVVLRAVLHEADVRHIKAQAGRSEP